MAFLHKSVVMICEPIDSFSKPVCSPQAEGRRAVKSSKSGKIGLWDIQPSEDCHFLWFGKVIQTRT